MLGYGQAGEGLIAKFIRSRGWYVLPVYEKEINNRKGPRLFTPDRELIVPDLFVFKGEIARWIEVKRKAAFSMYHVTGEWCTGIDQKYYEDYLKIDSETAWPVVLMFLQEGGRAKGDIQTDSPTGLYIGKLSELKDCEHHRWDGGGWGSPMVYWGIEGPEKPFVAKGLRLFATLEQLMAISQPAEDFGDKT
jgi:hypothetical protein